MDDLRAVEARRHRRRTLIGCLIALAGIAVVVGAARIGNPQMGIPPSILLAVVIAAAWYGGSIPGLLATAAGAGLFVFGSFAAPGGAVSPTREHLELGILLVLASLISLLAGRLHAGRQQTASKQQQILEEGERNRQALRTLQDKATQDGAARRAAEEQLRRMDWMLENRPPRETPAQPYGDMVQLNTRRTLADAIGPDLVEDSVRDYLDLLETSASVYERNGDYVFRSFSSGWCRFLDAASRRLCPTADNRVAAASGQWHCHESCWEAARRSMETGQPVDMECRGGIRLHAVPIRAGSVPVGSMTFGYGDPPTDPEQLRKLAVRYAVSVEDLAERARQYSSHPPFIIAQAKERLRRSARLLGEIVQRRRLEQELQFRLRELGEADRRKDEFLATLAHELRNPLAPIRNALQVISRAAEGGDHRRITAARGIMERQVKQMVRLIEDLLDVSRITRNKLELRKERVELATLVQQALESGRPVIEAARHELQVELPPEPVLLDADPVRLSQVFLNLLHNAAKYMQPGGRILLTASLVGDSSVAVSVRDEGIGIAPEMLHRVFDAFYQVDRWDSRSKGGLGVGLMLAQRLVDLHGGTVFARSEGVGKGAEFIVTLPIIAPAPAAPATIESKNATSATDSPPQDRAEIETPARRHRVLVIDDNADSVSSLETLLALEGHEVRVAHSGPEGLEIATSLQPNVVVCDIGLPGMSGYDVARSLRREAWGQAVTLIALTGWGQEEDRRRSRESGFDHHLVKPVEPTELVEMLAHVPISEWVPETDSAARSLA